MSKELSLEQARARAQAIDDQDMAAAAEWFRAQLKGDWAFLLKLQEFCQEPLPNKLRLVDSKLLLFVKRFALLGMHRVMEAALRKDTES